VFHASIRAWTIWRSIANALYCNTSTHTIPYTTSFCIYTSSSVNEHMDADVHICCTDISPRPISTPIAFPFPPYSRCLLWTSGIFPPFRLLLPPQSIPAASARYLLSRPKYVKRCMLPSPSTALPTAFCFLVNSIFVVA